MNSIRIEYHNELIQILENLVSTIDIMQEYNKSSLLYQNGQEAKEWLEFLKNHVDKAELKSLEDEIGSRLVYRFDIVLCRDENDKKRVELMRTYIKKSCVFLK